MASSPAAGRRMIQTGLPQAQFLTVEVRSKDPDRLWLGSHPSMEAPTTTSDASEVESDRRSIFLTEAEAELRFFCYLRPKAKPKELHNA